MIDALCECGRGPRERLRGRRRLFGCEICNDLDGRGEAQRNIIALLRQHETPLPLDYISNALRLKESAAHKVILRMHKQGYLKRSEEERVVDTKAFGNECQRTSRRALWGLAR